MRFVTIRHLEKETLAVRLGADSASKLLPLQGIPEWFAGGVPLPETVDELFDRPHLVKTLDEAIVVHRKELESYAVNPADVKYLPCVPRPGKVICIGLNYRKHAEETRAAIPTSPIVFSKFANAIAAHEADIPLPKHAEEIDYEGELCIVIGQRTEDVSREAALSHVFGYCVANDVSARDLQRRTSQWLLGKTFDRFAPMGPDLVTADEVGDPNALMIRTLVNGEVRQNSNTADMIFHCDELISYLSQYIALQPGDVILTGTPEGVILGYPKEERVWLKAGDEVTITIENLGTLSNRFTG